MRKRAVKAATPKNLREGLSAAVIVCSDSISEGKKEDRAGKAIIAKLEELDISIAEYTIIPDEQDQIVDLTQKHVAQKTDMIIFTGGTGMSPRDVTPEALRPMLDREIPGIEEAIRSYGQDRTPYSMLSRSVSGLIEDSLVLALPGSTNGAKESMDAIFPHVLHIFRVMEAARHDEL
ncbi:MAG: molybdopterin-binding protein [Balneolaceae bacterium]|nr:molybdopterin-binding protein [Balneolaceae bacterium]